MPATRLGEPEIRPGHPLARPRSVPEAAAILDRISRHCTYACARADACVEGECVAWRLELMAVDYLAAHWAAAEG
ncbi:MAG TPA: hypothetical protein VLA44_10755 [Clostridia bacterium]|nr:hypothetical protein [Clostridia bacterium]